MSRSPTSVHAPLPTSNGTLIQSSGGGAHNLGLACSGGSDATLDLVAAKKTPEEYKSLVWLETVDGDVESVEREVALLSPLIHREVLRYGHGTAEDTPVLLPKQVSTGVLKLILEYCRFHRVPGRSDKERKLFDEKFIRLDTRRLCELTSAADSLDMKPLVDLTSRALARMIEGKTPEEIRETFHLPDDLTEEEKLEPVKNAADDPRIRLLNRLYARKRKELQEKKLLKEKLQSEAALEHERSVRDDRSLDDLLEFIDSGSKEEVRKAKSKKKKKKRKEAVEDKPGQAEAELQKIVGKEKGKGMQSKEKDAAVASGEKEQQAEEEAEKQQVAAAEEDSQAAEEEDLHSEGMFNEAEFDDDDGLDPAEKEKLDREVEDFARRLNSDWQDRMQEILALASSSQDYQTMARAVAESGAPETTIEADSRELGLLQRFQELQRQHISPTPQNGISETGQQSVVLGQGVLGGVEDGKGGQVAAFEGQAVSPESDRHWRSRSAKSVDVSVSGGLSVNHSPRRPAGFDTLEPHPTAQGLPGVSALGLGASPMGLESLRPIPSPHSVQGEDLDPRMPFQQPEGLQCMGMAQDGPEIARLLQAFLRRIGMGLEVAVVGRVGAQVSEVDSQRILEQWDSRGRGMSMCLQLTSGAVLSLALTSPASLLGGSSLGDPRDRDRNTR